MEDRVLLLTLEPSGDQIAQAVGLVAVHMGMPDVPFVRLTGADFLPDGAYRFQVFVPPRASGACQSADAMRAVIMDRAARVTVWKCTPYLCRPNLSALQPTVFKEDLWAYAFAQSAAVNPDWFYCNFLSTLMALAFVWRMAKCELKERALEKAVIALWVGAHRERRWLSKPYSDLAATVCSTLDASRG